MIRFKFLTTSIMLFSSVLHAAETTLYVVQKGDTLSTIAQSKIGSPVYPRNGSLQVLLQWNPQISDKHFIFRGQTLVLAAPLLLEQAAVAPVAQPKEAPQVPKVRTAASEEAPPATAKVVASTITNTANANVVTQTVLVNKKPEAPVAAATAITTPTATPKAVVATNPAPTPPPALACPAPTPTAKPAETEEEVPHKLILSAGYAMTTITAKDQSSSASAELISSKDISLQAAWQQDWTQTFSTSFSAQLRSIDFQPSTNSAKSLSGTGKTNTAFAFNAEHKVSPRVAVNYGAKYGSELFVRGMNTATVTIDALPIGSVQLGTSLEAFRKGKTSVGLLGNYESLFAASSDAYSVNAGSAYRVGFYLQRKYGIDRSVELNVGYKNRSQDTSLLNFQERSFFGTLLFSTSLFEGK